MILYWMYLLELLGNLHQLEHLFCLYALIDNNEFITLLPVLKHTSLKTLGVFGSVITPEFVSELRKSLTSLPVFV